MRLCCVLSAAGMHTSLRPHNVGHAWLPLVVAKCDGILVSWLSKVCPFFLRPNMPG
jgi:hypothetical protein